MRRFESDGYLFYQNAEFIENLLISYLQDPNSVDQSWHSIFQNMKISDMNNYKQLDQNSKSFSVNNASSIKFTVIAMQLIDAYRRLGHTAIQFDPLGVNIQTPAIELDYKWYNIKADDLSQTVNLEGTLNLNQTNLDNVIKKLTKIYQNKIGYEFAHVENLEERIWLQSYVETDSGDISISKNAKLDALNCMTEIYSFENFLHTKFLGGKRFSIEGLEASIAAIDFIIKYGATLGADEFVLGMAHRGRLATLAKILRKPYDAMFYEFAGNVSFPKDPNIAGDVKYHMGASCDVELNGHNVHISLTPNPSHLETVNVVVNGRVKAKLDISHSKVTQIVPLLIHGDASFCGQGSIMESLMMSKLKPYDVGGSVHLIFNNQLGFTATPDVLRFTRYCTDIAKSINAPIFHVNAMDVDELLYVVKFAIEYRQKFGKDVFIDIIGYRRYGHNEGDEPMFTQPLAYNKVHDQQLDKLNVVKQYKNQLISEGLLTEEEFSKGENALREMFNKAHAESANYQPTMDKIRGAGEWNKYDKIIDEQTLLAAQPITGVEKNTLLELGKVLYTVPKDFNINAKIARQFAAKEQMFQTGNGIDWATAEALAYGSLLIEGFPVRLSGEDAERGTFSHRHAVLVDQVDEKRYIPLDNIKNILGDGIAKDKKVGVAHFSVYSTILSELGTLGFEYGYSTSAPNTLTLWEAQYGDFANGAQMMIDQYVVSGESKWLRMSGLVLLLPHGYQGEGPEHSSARLERYLELCAMANMYVCNCSTPASFFHVLRRQMHIPYRKPLIIMTPKSLLRHKLAVSSISDISGDTKFETILLHYYKAKSENASIPNVKVDKTQKVKRIVFCSGKIYYDLYEKREQSKAPDATLLVTMEQLYPFDESKVAEIIKAHMDAEVIWCQEEQKNMGAYSFVSFYFDKILRDLKHKQVSIRYVGRVPSASTATGSSKVHNVEQTKIIEEAVL